jgi:polysaccharide pyruvyl transferase WcaK-like protein
MKLHELICKRGCKTVLLGCSLDEKMFEDPDFVEDMRRYDYISARESLTYQLLQNAGLTNIGLAPDSAFTLPTEKLPLPEYFIEGNTIGLNVSPMVIRKEVSSGIVMKNYKRLIHSILDKTDCAVALIPHVVWEDNDDRTALQELYSEFENTKRVVMIDDCNCMQLKGYISSCRLFVGARTHATIAAYSSNVPTLVLGYSIKSRGIAKDLFGSDEKYVIPVQALENEGDLEKAFWWLWENEDIIRQRLEAVMPDYVAQVKSIKGKINLK